jgi:hypothetical protein
MIRMTLSLLLFLVLTVRYQALRFVDHVARRIYFLALTFQEALLHYSDARK